MRRKPRREIRQSQTIIPFGVGGIFDIQGESFVGCDIYEWQGRGVPVTSDRLTAALNVRELKAADPIETGPGARASGGVPYARFPAWLFCQKCRRMVRWLRSMEQEGQPALCPTCTGGKRRLVPMRWVQICERGHLADVNWVYWAHFGAKDPEQKQCRRDNQLSFETAGGRGSGGLNTLKVRCRACNASRTLARITGQRTLEQMGVRCTGRQPWQSRDSAADCDQVPRAVQRGASNVYFPLAHSSIEIPSVTRSDTQSDIAVRVKNSIWFRPLCEIDRQAQEHVFLGMVEKLADEVDLSDDVVISVVEASKREAAGEASVETAQPGDLRAEEWAAFITEWSDLDPQGDFFTRHVPLLTPEQEGRADFDGLAASVRSVVIADRLREVRALEGFHRVKPAGRDKLVRADLDRRLGWLPASEVFGEGVFLALDEARLVTWEERDDVRARTRELDERIERHFMIDRIRERTGPTLLPRYVLLHTLSHLLIRRLAFESGYSAASLRERVYGGSSAGPTPTRQAGALVYTAAGDAEGTLGGLARQGERGALADSLIQALEDATWCSADPLCSENLAQGFGSLNYAACHACSLVSETSCEAMNSLLDRGLVVGAPGVRGFFEDVVEATVGLAANAVRVRL